MWGGPVDDIPEPGKARKQRRVSAPTKAEAQRLMDKINQRRLDHRQHRRNGTAGITVGEFAPLWLSDKESDLAESTARRYRGIIDQRIIDSPLSDVPLADLTEQQVRQWIKEIRSAPGRRYDKLSARTVSHNFKILRSILAEANRRGLTLGNVSDGVKHPKVPHAPDLIRCWTVDQVADFMSAAQASASPNAGLWEAATGLTLGTGLRLAEVCGLKRKDIDQDNRTLTVRRTRRKPGIATGPLKNKASARTLTISDEVGHYLERLRAIADADRAALGPDWTDTGFVVVLPDGNPPRPESFTRRLRRDCERFGIEYITWHGLRHTYATLALLNGAPLHVVSRDLGHASPTITLDYYAHLLPGSTAATMASSTAFIFSKVRQNGVTGQSCDDSRDRPAADSDNPTDDMGSDPSVPNESNWSG